MSEPYCKCRKCGAPRHIDTLDAKPELTRKMKRIRAKHGALHMLRYGADSGLNFTRLECANCFGPGYESLAALSQEA